MIKQTMIRVHKNTDKKVKQIQNHMNKNELHNVTKNEVIDKLASKEIKRLK